MSTIQSREAQAQCVVLYRENPSLLGPVEPQSLARNLSAVWVIDDDMGALDSREGDNINTTRASVDVGAKSESPDPQISNQKIRLFPQARTPGPGTIWNGMMPGRRPGQHLKSTRGIFGILRCPVRYLSRRLHPAGRTAHGPDSSIRWGMHTRSSREKEGDCAEHLSECRIPSESKTIPFRSKDNDDTWAWGETRDRSRELRFIPAPNPPATGASFPLTACQLVMLAEG